MSTDDDGKKPGGTGLPLVPALPSVQGSHAVDETDLDDPKGGAPEQLGFHLRFEAGEALLALDDIEFAPGVHVKRALFEVPDVEFPLDVTGGATRFQDRRLTLRGVELAIDHDSLFVPDRLRAAGLRLLRERTRSGGVELLVTLTGPVGEVPVRARGLFVAAGDAGVAVVLHEIIPFGSAPRPRLELGAVMLDALAIPGGQPARAMVRRAHPFRAVFSRLLPAYGWKVPAMGDVRVHDVQFHKGAIVLRAWSGDRPEGWKAPRKQKRGPVEEAVALAVFADDLTDAEDEEARVAVVDRLIDSGNVPTGVAPFAAELLRRNDRRRAEGDDLVAAALASAPEHLGLLSAHVDDANLEAAEHVTRFLALGEAADRADEAWVSARAFLCAAEIARDDDDPARAREAALAAWDADPTHGATGALAVELALSARDEDSALRVGRAALERMDDPSDAEQLAVMLAPVAQRIDGADAARALLRRALRREDRLDALMALVRLEIADENLDRAAETLARLLVLEEQSPDLKADIQLLAAALAEARGDLDAARMHLSRAREARPDDALLAIRQAELHQRAGDAERALEALTDVVERDPAPTEALLAAARMRVARGDEGDAERAQTLLARVDEEAWTDEVRRLDAEARALLGDVGPLAEILESQGADGDPAARAEGLARAGHLFAQAGRADDAARTLANALSLGEPAVPAVAGLLEEQGSAELAGAFAAQLDDDVEAGWIEAVAARLAEAGKPAIARQVLSRVQTAEAARERARLAAEADDGALELEERQWLADHLEGEADREELRQTWRRIALLREEAVGDLAGAADAWAAAAEHGAADEEAWLDVALRSGDADRLAVVLRRPGADASEVPTSALRDVVTSPEVADHPATRVRLLEEVAERDGGDEDARAFLSEAREHLPTKVAAAAFARFAAVHENPAWLLESARLEHEADDVNAALQRLLGALGSPLDDYRPIIDELFERALEANHAVALVRATEALVARDDVDRDERLGALRRAADALSELDEDAWHGVLELWLTHDPAADDALVPLVERLLTGGERHDALDRLAQRVEAGTDVPDEVRTLLEAAADDARGVGAALDEARARELLVRSLGADGADPRTRVGELERLAELYVEAQDAGQAVRVLAERATLGGAPEELAACWRRVAELELVGRDDPRAAAVALGRALEHEPDDDDVSRQLQGLLTELEDWEALAAEHRRRAHHLAPGPERTALLVKLGDLLAERLGRSAEAEQAWLSALRTAFAEAPFTRLLASAERQNSHRLFVRAHLAAAAALRGETAASVHAAEAGAALAALLDRPALAVPAYRYAADQSEDPIPSLRALVELHRATGDLERGLAVLDEMAELVSGRDRAMTWEMRADLLEALTEDRAAADEARQQALREDPTLRISALALERSLREQDRLRDAIDVRRQLADAAEGPSQRAQTYAMLAESARDDLEDLELAADLAHEALQEQPRLVHVRLLRVDALEGAGRVDEAADELGWLLDSGDLPDADLVALARRKAAIERDQSGDLQRARHTLRQALARAPESDVVAREVADLEEELGETAAASQALLAALDHHPEGSEALGNRRAVLERVARLLDDGGDRETSLRILNEAAELGRLGRGAELRRARIAEQLGEWTTTATSLELLLTIEGTDAEETVALLGRLAVAAERADEPERALGAWRERAERVTADVESLLAVERLARQLDDPESARHAAETLVRLEVGEPEEQRVRFIWLARDSRDREEDSAGAYLWFERALAHGTDGETLREMFAVAEEVGDRSAALEALRQLGELGEELPAAALLRRAELGFDVSQDVESALRDVRAALRQDDVDEERAALVLQLLAEQAPEQILASLLEHDGVGSREALALRRSLGPLGRYTAVELSQLADRFPADAEVVEAAARAEVDAGEGVRACDRLIALADRVEEGGDEDAAAELRERAADALLDADTDPGALLGRFQSLRSALAHDRARRAKALHDLRHAEAFEPVTELLEEALGEAPVEERRDLRMELVAVLRSGLEDPGRAAAYLEAQVGEDNDDREAWGELLECLDELGDQERLAHALGRRIEVASGLERRELVRRRSALLLDLGRGDDAADDLVSVRADAPADPELKALERRVREAQGPEAVAAFLAAELGRGEVDGDPEDARDLLALPAELTTSDDRVMALVTLAHEPGEAERAGIASLESALPAERRVLEARGVAELLEGDARDAFLVGLALAARTLGRRDLLALYDGLLAAGVGEAPLHLGTAATAARWRVEGPSAALGGLPQLLDAGVDDDEVAALELSLALRIGDRDLARAAAASLALDERAAAMVEAGGPPKSAGLAQALTARAEGAARDAARGVPAVVAAVRTADVELATRWLESGADPVLAEGARRCRALKLTPERLALRLRLADHLVEGALEELSAIAEAATELDDLGTAAEALDGVLALGGPTAERTAARARVALARGEEGSEVLCFRAAEHAEEIDQQLEWRRKAIELLVRAGAPSGELESALFLFIGTAPDDVGLVQEAMRIAEATQQHHLLDSLLAEEAARSGVAEVQIDSIRRRVDHLNRKLRQPGAAFRVLMEGERSHPSAGFREEAYQLAAREGLADQLAQVVDDPLARAGVLGVLGRVADARSALEGVEGHAADLLRADLCAAAGDIEGELAALEPLASAPDAGVDVLRRIAERAADMGDHDVALHTALSLAQRERSAGLIDAISRSLGGASEPATERALDALPELLADFDDEAVVGRALTAWLEVAEERGLDDRRRAALRMKAERAGSDAGWAQYLEASLPALSALDLADELRPHLDRVAILRALARQDAPRLASGLEQLLAEHGDAVAEGLEACHDLEPLADVLLQVLIGALRSTGRASDAARLVLAGGGSTHDRALAAADIALEGGEAEVAAEALLALPLAAFDLSARQLAGRVADAAPERAVELLVRAAAAAGTEEAATAVLAAAANAPTPELAAAVAAWRLAREPVDLRAWRLAADHGSDEARAFFTAQLAARGEVAWAAAEQAPALDADLRRFVVHARRELEQPRPEPRADVLWKARYGDEETSRAAWQELAEQAGERGEHVAAARLLVRAGVPLSDAPIEVRLVADAGLSIPSARADAVSEALLHELQGDEERAAPLVEMLQALDAEGWAGARHRAALPQDDTDAGRWRDLVDRVDRGESVDSQTVMSAIGRHPTPARRAAGAALLASVGALDLARALQPALFSRRGAGDADARKDMGPEMLWARVRRAHEDGDALLEVGLRRQLAAVDGVRGENERALRRAAIAADRPLLAAESLLREASTVDDDATRAALLQERVKLCQELGRADVAVEDARAAAELLPGDADALRLWVNAAEAASAPQQVVSGLTALEQLLMNEPEERAAVVLRRARVLREQLGSAGGALAALDASIATLGDRGPLLAERARCLLELGDAAQAAATLVKAANITRDDPDARRAMRSDAVDLFLELGDLARAGAALERNAEDDDEAALDRLEALAREHDNKDLLARALRLRLAAEPTSESRRQLTLERARLLYDDLERPDEAIELLEKQAAEDAADLGVRLALADWYLKSRRIQEAADAYRSAAGIEELPAAAVATAAREAASLYSVLGELDEAGPLAERALAAGLGDRKCVTIALAWRRGQEDWARVDELLGDYLELAPSSEEAAYLWMERAGIRRQHTGDEAGARAALHRALEVAPDNEVALDAMRLEAEQSDSWGALRAALSRAVEVSDEPDRQLRWLRDIAHLDKDRFDDVRAADATVTRALELAPEDGELLVMKAELLVNTGQLDGLPAMLARAEAAGVDRLPPALSLARGDALLISGDREAAMAAFERATDDDELAERAWDRLLDLAEGLGDNERLGRYLARARAATDDDERLARLASRELRVQLSAGDRQGAAEAAVVVLRTDPGNDEAFTLVKADLLGRRKLEQLSPLFGAWAEAPSDGSKRAGRLAEYGTFLLDELGAEGPAREAFDKALKADPHENVALIRLADIAYNAADHERALELMDRVNPGLWPRGETALLFERADCAVRLKKPDADQRLRQVLRRDAKHIGALELLVALGHDRGDDDTAEFALERLSAAISPREDPERAAKVLSELAQLRAKQERYEDAVAAAEKALELGTGALAHVELVAELREKAGRALDAAEAWRRVAGMRPAGEQSEALEHRARLLEEAERGADAANAWVDLYETTSVERYRDEALRLARELDEPEIFDRLGVAYDGASKEMRALRQQIDANLEEGDVAQALALLGAALRESPRDDELLELGLATAGDASDAAAAVTFCEELLQVGLEPQRVKDFAALAGRLARDRLGDPQRAAGLLYRAHQAGPEDIDVRIDLTHVYSQIDELVDAAHTGVLQLLRRAPAEPRVFALAADVAAAQHNLERARAMRAAEHLLLGKEPAKNGGSPFGASTATPSVPSDRLEAAVAPTGFAGPFHALMQTVATPLEAVLLDRNVTLTGSRKLEDASAVAARLRDRIDAIIPGRAIKLMLAPTSGFHVGQQLAVLLPDDAIRHDDAVLAAHVGRALALARSGGVLVEALSAGDDERILGTLRAAFVTPDPTHGGADRLLAALDEASREQAVALASEAFATEPDLTQWRSAAIRMADRFALFVSGNLAAALNAGPLPGLLSGAAAAQAERLAQSPRALDLASYAARDSAWALRRELGFTS